MKLIIDIDEQHFEILQSAVRNGMGDNSQKIIANGTPLDDVLNKIRAKIAEYKDDKIIHAERNEMIDIVIDIIDKYRNEVSS